MNYIQCGVISVSCLEGSEGIHPTRVYVAPLRVNFWPDTFTNPVELGGAGAVVVEVVVAEVVVVGVETDVVVAVPGTHWE